MTKREFESIDDYIVAQSESIQPILKRIRSAIAAAAPGATEKISYQIPTFYLNGNLVHFAAFENHIGFYPTPSGVRAFQKELSGYEYAKGSIQFPVDKPIPLILIRKIVKFRVGENAKKTSKRRAPQQSLRVVTRKSL
jgi:uncharacterized protein YdhG (YjbR/CyaY superfamily)